MWKPDVSAAFQPLLREFLVGSPDTVKLLQLKIWSCSFAYGSCCGKRFTDGDSRMESFITPYGLVRNFPHELFVVDNNPLTLQRTDSNE